MKMQPRARDDNLVAVSERSFVVQYDTVHDIMCTVFFLFSCTDPRERGPYDSARAAVLRRLFGVSQLFLLCIGGVPLSDRPHACHERTSLLCTVCRSLFGGVWTDLCLIWMGARSCKAMGVWVYISLGREHVLRTLWRVMAPPPAPRDHFACAGAGAGVGRCSRSFVHLTRLDGAQIVNEAQPHPQRGEVCMGGFSVVHRSSVVHRVLGRDGRILDMKNHHMIAP